MPSATVTGSNREGARADPEGQRAERTAPEVGDDHRTAGEPIAGLEQAHRRLVGQVVRHLAHQHDVHRLLAERRRARAGDGARHSTRERQTRRHRASLESHRHEAHAAAGRPAHGGARQVAEAGAEVERG